MMLYDVIGKSFILQCLYVLPPGPFMYPFPLFLCLAAAALLAGMAAERFLLRRKQWAGWIPLLCAAAEAVFEALFQMTVHGGSKAMAYDGFFTFLVWGVALLYVLLGALAGWLTSRARAGIV